MTAGNHAWRRRAGWLLLWLLVGLALVALNLKALRSAGFETGDFAANSLLMQDAKNLSLWTGNYSRVGFNHPGPAILLVLALGESILHDGLGAVRSPLVGQLVAAALYAAAWLVAFACVLRRMLPAPSALVGAAAFAASSAVFNHQVFGGLWFPDLYYFPFAVLLISLARLAGGFADSLTSLAVSAGFLVNGHASFVAITGVLFVGALVWNALAARMAGMSTVLGLDFLRTQRRALLLNGGVFLLFWIPFAIETVVRFPGPAADYAAFGGQTSNSLKRSIDFVAVYWGGRPQLLFGIAMAFAIWALAGERGASRATIRAFVVVLAIATGATVLYAKFGVDDLAYRYLAMFYYAVPASAIALAVGIAFPQSVSRRNWTAAALVAAIALLIAGTKIREPAEYIAFYDDPEIPALTQALMSLKPPGERLVLSYLSTDDASGKLWATMLGVEVLAKRRGIDLFCIDVGWHIAFTRHAACTPDEVERGRRLVIKPAAAAASRQVGAKVLERHGLAFHTSDSIEPREGYISVAARPEMFSEYVLRSGWSAVEGSFVWSLGQRATLRVPIRRARGGRLALDLGAYLPRPESRQNVEIFVEGQPAAGAIFEAGHERRTIDVAFAAQDKSSLTVELRIAHPMSPREETKQSIDARRLGVSLFGFSIEATP